MKHLLIVFFLAFSFTSFGQNSVPLAKWKTYATQKYTIRFPKNIKLEKGKTEGNEFTLHLPQQKNQPQETLNLFIQDFEGETIDTKYYKYKNIDGLKSIVPDLTVFEDVSITIHSVSFDVVTCKGTYKNSELIWRQYFSVYNQKSYLFTYISIEALFKENKALVDQIVQQFQLK